MCAVFRGSRISPEHLTHADGRRVHEVSATDLHDLIPLHRFGGQGLVQARERRRQLAFDLHGPGDAHRRGERVVGRLAHVDVIVGMDARRVGLRRHVR